MVKVLKKVPAPERDRLGQLVVLQDPIPGRWLELVTAHPDRQVVAWDTARNTVAGVGLTCPLSWSGHAAELPGSFAELFKSGLSGTRKPTVLVGVYVIVLVSYRSRRLASDIVRAMWSQGASEDHESFLVLARPKGKANYPLVPIEEYIRWVGSDDHPVDDWLRLHSKLGGRIIGTCPRASVYRAPLAAWEDRYGRRFTESGEHIVEHALAPLAVDAVARVGEYAEPNVWICYDCDSPKLVRHST